MQRCCVGASPGAGRPHLGMSCGRTAAVSQCVLRKTYPLSNLLRTHTFTHTGCNSYPVLVHTSCTGAHHWCIPLVHTTGMPYQPATLQTCEPCPANRDNSQTTAAWSELSVVAHDRGLRSLPAGHNLYHSYQFNEWYRQIYSPLIQSEPKILYNNIYFTILTNNQA